MSYWARRMTNLDAIVNHRYDHYVLRERERERERERKSEKDRENERERKRVSKSYCLAL
jgi:hypothetical protein